MAVELMQSCRFAVRQPAICRMLELLKTFNERRFIYLEQSPRASGLASEIVNRESFRHRCKRLPKLQHCVEQYAIGQPTLRTSVKSIRPTSWLCDKSQFVKGTIDG